MFHLKLSVPAKNFILGEYVVLDEGPALLFTHAPRFSLIVSEQTPQLTGIHPASPAGRFYQENFSLFTPYQIIFVDPYQGMGGLGASSAQFILLFSLYFHLKNKPFSLETLMQTYKQFAWHGQGYPPSGADLIAQTVGGFLSWNPKSKEVTYFDWPFEELSFHFVHTRHKVKTHEHLANLQLDFSLEELKEFVTLGLQSLIQTNYDAFCSAINSYAALLHQYNLTTDNTLRLLDDLKKNNWVKAAKGCGALGSDVLFIITDKTAEKSLKEWVKQHQLRYLCNQKSMSSGLSVKGL